MKREVGVELVSSTIQTQIRVLKQDLDMVNTYLEKSPNSSMTETWIKMTDDITDDIVKLKKALEVLND